MYQQHGNFMSYLLYYTIGKNNKFRSKNVLIKLLRAEFGKVLCKNKFSMLFNAYTQIIEKKANSLVLFLPFYSCAIIILALLNKK